MTDIRLVVSDVDGTLLTSRQTISPATLREVRRIVEHGVHFSIASGRATRRVREVLEGISLSVPVIGSNGAVVEDVNTGEIVHSAYMGERVAQRVIRAALAHDVYYVVIDTPEGWYYQAGRIATPEQRQRISGPDQTWVDDLAKLLDASDLQIFKIVIHAEEPELTRIEEDVRRIGGVHVTSSWRRNREIVVEGVDKAAAAKILAARLGLRPEQVLAIGDNRNDLEMVRWAGVGVAMGNAIPELKDAADWITATNDEDGVALALRRFIPSAGGSEALAVADGEPSGV